jgi:hypothetical protein
MYIHIFVNYFIIFIRQAQKRPISYRSLVEGLKVRALHYKSRIFLDVASLVQAIATLQLSVGFYYVIPSYPF